MATNPNRDEFYGDSPSDISLSTWEYHDFIDCLSDGRLSPKGLMKFKNLSLNMSCNNFAVATLAFLPSYMATRWLTGFSSRGLASSRFNYLGMAVLYPLFLYVGFTRPTPRKLYTQIIADNGDDGEYVRSMLASNKPGLWKKISAQMKSLNFNFPEMLDSNLTTEFPVPTSFAATKAV